MVSSEPNATFLIAEEFETLTEAREVHDAARRVVDYLNGILFIDVTRCLCIGSGIPSRLGLLTDGVLAEVFGRRNGHHRAAD